MFKIDAFRNKKEIYSTEKWLKFRVLWNFRKGKYQNEIPYWNVLWKKSTDFIAASKLQIACSQIGSVTTMYNVLV